MRSRSATLANGQGHDETPVELMIYGLAGRGCDRDLAHEELTRPKLAILFEPCGRSLQAFLPRQQRLPAEHAIDLRPIAGVPDDLSGTILDELNPIHPVVHELDHIAGNFDNRAMLATCDIESLTVNEFVRRLQDQVNSAACIFDVEKIASGLAVAVNRELFVE